MSGEDPRLYELFSDPAWDWLRARIRKALELEHALPVRFVRKNPSEAELRAAHSLMGRSLQSPKSKSLSLPRDELLSLLRGAELCDDMRAVTEVVDGPVHPRAALRRARDAAWQGLREAGPLSPENPELFFQGLRRLANQDPEKGTRLLKDLHRLLHEIQPDDQLPVRAAARIFGNSHALDSDRPLTRLLALYFNHPPGDTRQLWNRLGLTPDEVSSTVLTLGLPFSDPDPAAAAATLLARARTPHRILLRHFRAPFTPVAERVYVCENPAVLEAAAEANFPYPLVCTEGQPSHACTRLLDACAAAGIPLFIRADFDPSGLRIVHFLLRRYPKAGFWRFDAETFRQLPPGPPLEGEVPETPWDPELSATIAAAGHGVHEEQLLDLLLRVPGRPLPE